MRLTYSNADGVVWFKSQSKNDIWLEPCEMTAHDNRIAIAKLATYEDAEEQGRLVILPCKVGDALFVTDEGTILPAVRMVESVTWRDGKISILAVNKRTGSAYHCFAEDIGKTVFLTREEAKAAMKEERKADV